MGLVLYPCANITLAGSSTFVIHLGIWQGTFAPICPLVLLRIILTIFAPCSSVHVVESAGQIWWSMLLGYALKWHWIYKTNIITWNSFILLIYPMCSLLLLFKLMFSFEGICFINWLFCLAAPVNYQRERSLLTVALWGARGCSLTPGRKEDFNLITIWSANNDSIY